MSTNYYFCKHYSIKKKCMEDLKDNILSKLKKTIISDNKAESFLNDCIYENLSNNYEHICLVKYKRKPSFQITEHYSNMDELIKYYNDNKNDLEILDEYGDIISWEDFINKINDFMKNDTDIIDSGSAIIDDRGCHWYKFDFC